MSPCLPQLTTMPPTRINGRELGPNEIAKCDLTGCGDSEEAEGQEAAAAAAQVRAGRHLGRWQVEQLGVIDLEDEADGEEDGRKGWGVGWLRGLFGSKRSRTA